MREIKFRAWVKKDYDDHGIVDYMEDDASCFNDPFQEHKDGNIVLMQYAGLKDKGGVEIYEGDIVEVYSWVSNVYRGVVKFGEYEQDASGGEYKPRPVLGFYIEALKGQLDKWGDEFLFDFEMQESIFSDLENSKVIGNIYEHPHLLEVSE